MSEVGPVSPTLRRRLWYVVGVGGLFMTTACAEGAQRPDYDAWHQSIGALSLGPGGWVQMLSFIAFGAVILSTVTVWHRILAAGKGARAQRAPVDLLDLIPPRILAPQGMTLNPVLVCSVAFILACDGKPSPSVPSADLGPSGQVASRTFIRLGGSEQYVEMTGASDTNPILLFIHGGPGWPQTPMLRYLNADLTKAFTLVSWDQRGAGLSFLRDSAPPDVTLDQIVADGHELTQLLKARFRTPRIFLAGFSWGSIIGVHLAERYPHDYAAYIGISQIINPRRGMTITRDWIATRARAVADTTTLALLTRIRAADPRLCDGEMSCFVKQYELLSKYGGAVFNPASDVAVTNAMKAYPDYAAYDWNKGFAFSAGRLEGAVFGTDLSRVTHLSVPVFLMLGRHDWNVPPSLSTEWLARLDAPFTQVIWFDSSGHGPLEEQPRAFAAAMIRLLSH